VGCTYRSFLNDFLGFQWILQKVRYSVEPFVIQDMNISGINIYFIVSYLHDLIKEIGVFIRVDRTGSDGPNNYRRSICHFNDQEQTVLELSKGPRQAPLSPAQPPPGGGLLAPMLRLFGSKT
jgi:hypothetical protein